MDSSRAGLFWAWLALVVVFIVVTATQLPAAVASHFVGSGEADVPRVVSKLRSGGYRGPLVIEREAGDNRIADILEGKQFLEDMLG